MKHFFGNIEDLTLNNENYRHVLFTSTHSQLVVMSIKPQQEIGTEIHKDHDQFIRIEKGTGLAIIDDTPHNLHDGDALVIPAGSIHNIINTSDTDLLKLYTIYSPAEHEDGLIQKTKPEQNGGNAKFVKYTNKLLSLINT